MPQKYRWKVTNTEGFIPETSYLTSDRVAARVDGRRGRTVTIVAWDG